MKKIIAALLVLAMALMSVGCGIVEIPNEGLESPSKDESKDNSIIDDVVGAIFGSYEDILNEYSQKLRDATPVLIEEYNEEAKSNQDGLMGLATLCSEKVSELAKISNEGIQEMAQLYFKKGSGSYEEYSEWAGKLQDVYMEEASKIQDAYMDSVR